jgi:CD109 antigen
MTLQRFDLPSPSKYVEVEASGFGTAIVQVSWQYNLAVSAEEPAFFMNPQLGKTSTENFMQLNVCAYYKAGNETNMAVMEVDLPSGYVAEVDALPSISQRKEVKRIDTSDGDTKVIIYFDRITREEICVTVPAHQNYKVANHKAVPVTLYDYYNRAQTARLFYEPMLSSSCDICDGETECGQSCNSVSDADGNSKGGLIDGKGKASPGTRSSVWSLTGPILMLLLVKFLLK